jgi:hypothetical protein
MLQYFILLPLCSLTAPLQTYDSPHPFLSPNANEKIGLLITFNCIGWLNTGCYRRFRPRGTYSVSQIRNSHIVSVNLVHQVHYLGGIGRTR